jgi:hypothetical protein
VKILGRTVGKVTIGEWTNYWYYIEVKLYMYDDASINGKSVFNMDTRSDFWAFGEFLEPGDPVIYEDIPDSLFDSCD